MDYDIKKVDDLPDRVRLTTGVYEKIIADILSREDGTYLITLGNSNKPQTILQQLYKRVKGKDGLSVHQITGKVYVVKKCDARKK